MNKFRNQQTNAAKIKKKAKKSKNLRKTEKPENKGKNPYLLAANGPAHTVRRLSGSESLPH
jgi:hypothetical protein